MSSTDVKTGRYRTDQVLGRNGCHEVSSTQARCDVGILAAQKAGQVSDTPQILSLHTSQRGSGPNLRNKGTHPTAEFIAPTGLIYTTVYAPFGIKSDPAGALVLQLQTHKSSPTYIFAMVYLSLMRITSLAVIATNLVAAAVTVHHEGCDVPDNQERWERPMTETVVVHLGSENR